MSPSRLRPGPLAAGLLLAWYAATMARGLMWFDSGEFGLVGAQLGVGHPPGQPLYTLLLWLAAAGPWSPLVGMNALSALSAALCALPADALMRRLSPELPGGTRLVALLAVGALAPVWDQATRIELYAPATLILLTLIAAGAAVVEADRGPRAWAGLGLGVGLLGCLNGMFGLAAAIAVGGYALPRLIRNPRRLALATGAAALGAAVGLLPYLQIVAAAGDPGQRFIWGNFGSTEGWLAFLSGRDYGHTAHSEWGKVPTHLVDWLVWLLGQGALATAVIGLIGWTTTPGARQRLWLLAVPLGMGVAFTFTYGRYFPQVPDYNGYLTPALWLGAAGLGALLSRARPALAGLLAAALLLGGVATGERPIWARTRAPVDLPHQLATAWLDQTPPSGVLLVESDHLVFPLMYLQAVEGHRRDVVVINVGFASSGWYWRWLWATHPELPRIPLAAPTSAVRLARLLAAMPERAVRVEDVRHAIDLRRPFCLDTFGLRADASCRTLQDDPQAFAALQATGGQTPDLITGHVLANLAFTRAQAAWARGDASAAITALATSAPGDRPLPPPGLKRPPKAGPLPLPDTPTLIGDATHNLRLGQALLVQFGQPGLAEAWAL